MKHLISKLPPFLRNFYVVITALFIFWLAFFDSNDLLTQAKLSSTKRDLEKTRDFYEEKINEVKADREALLTNDVLLEKIAREKYFMKKENEEIFVVVEE